MIYKCRIHTCNFRREIPLDINILTQITQKKDMPIEDYFLYMQKLFTESGSKGWSGVKIHMGRMHKDDAYYGIWPELEYSDGEKVLMESFEYNFTKQLKEEYS